MTLTAESDTIITLTDEEWAVVVEVGKLRNVEAERRGYRQGDGHEWDNAEANHIQGAGGESAAAKFYGIRWDATINGFKAVPDLLCCEVRSTQAKRPYLRIKKRDYPNRSWAFILVTFLGGRTYRIEGWTFGYEGMIPKNIDPNPFSLNDKWRVQIDDLHAPFTLSVMLSKLRDLQRGNGETEACADKPRLSI